MNDRLLTVALSVIATYALMQFAPEHSKELKVERLIVTRELIVSDTGMPWEKGFEAQQIPRGLYARSLGDGPGGLWVRSRLIKGEIDDPFDDRFHALEQDGSLRRAPGHISWNEHHYAIVAVGAQGRRTASSQPARAGGLARLRWDSIPGADAYVVVRDGQEIVGPLRIEGSQKEWTDKAAQ